MAVHVVRDNGGGLGRELVSGFLAPLLTNLVQNHFDGLKQAKENALLGELARASTGMPNTTPEQGNGFAGQFTPPGTMQNQGSGLSQLLNILSNPRFKSVNAARAMELAKPFLTEQFYNGFNPADSAQMMRGMGMGYVPTDAAKYYGDMYRHMNPHQSFQSMNLGDRMVYGGFNPANGQFTQGGSMAVGMDPYNAGKLANERQKMANDYSLGIRRDDTDRYRIDTQDNQFGAELGYKNRQQDWTENPNNPKNLTKKELYVDAGGNLVRVDPYAEAGDTGVKAAPQTQQVKGGDVTKLYYNKAVDARKSAAAIENNEDLTNGLNGLKEQLSEVDPNSAEAADIIKKIQALETQKKKHEEEANIYEQLYANPNATYYIDSSTGQTKPIPRQYIMQMNPQGYYETPQETAQYQQQIDSVNQSIDRVSGGAQVNTADPTGKARLNSTLNKFGGKYPVKSDGAGQKYIPVSTYGNIMKRIEAGETEYGSAKEFLNALRANGIKISGSDGVIVQNETSSPLDSTLSAISGDAAPKGEATLDSALSAISGDTAQAQSPQTENSDISKLSVSAIKQEMKEINMQMKRNPEWKRTQPVIGRRLEALNEELKRRNIP